MAELKQLTDMMNAEFEKMKRGFGAEIGKLKAEMVQMDGNHGQRIQLLEQEVLKMQRTKEQSGEKSRDLFVMKKGFAAIPKYTGKVEDYDDWRFQAQTFLGMEDGFEELIEWIEKQTKEPEQDDLDDWEADNKGRNATLMNDQMYSFLCLNTREKALATVKNLGRKKKINGVITWWKFHEECRALTGQRIQGLANAIYKPTRVKKYSDVMGAIEKWERDIRRFEVATGKLAEETKTFSLRQLVPEELDHMITAQSNTLKDYEKVHVHNRP